MVDAVAAKPQFTTVNYVTKDGEHISATKNNGIVTLVGDKNGTRQMSIEEFKQELVKNCADIKLENSPKQDTFEFSKNTNPEGYKLKPETPESLGIPADIKAEQDKRIAEILKDKGRIDPNKDKVFYNPQTGELDTIKPGLIADKKPEVGQNLNVAA